MQRASIADAADQQDGVFQGVAPGDTIDVHWVYSSCAVQPGQGLGSCLSAACANPQLRVEAQVFLLVNDPYALNFQTMVYDNTVIDARHQAKALPTHTGTPIVLQVLPPAQNTQQKNARPIKSPGAFAQIAQS